jgi:Na+-exporting ATPase
VSLGLRLFRLSKPSVQASLGLHQSYTPTDERLPALPFRLNSLAYLLLGAALLLALIVVASTGFRDVPMSLATYAVATAVSVLPASLIAVVSLTLATASRELARRNALVRRMGSFRLFRSPLLTHRSYVDDFFSTYTDAIEALSAVTDICSDKTGTLTVGKMVVRKAWIPTNTAHPTADRPATLDTSEGQAYTAESGSDPFYPRGVVRASARRSRMPRTATRFSSVSGLAEEIEEDEDDDDDLDSGDVVRPSEMEAGLEKLVLCASLCNMATIHKGDDDRWEASGDATGPFFSSALILRESEILMVI